MNDSQPKLPKYCEYIFYKRNGFPQTFITHPINIFTNFKRFYGENYYRDTRRLNANRKVGEKMYRPSNVYGIVLHVDDEESCVVTIEVAIERPVVWVRFNCNSKSRGLKTAVSSGTVHVQRTWLLAKKKSKAT